MSAIVYACPHNGELLPCPTCGVPFPHRREELANWRKPSMCETHGARLVPMLPTPRVVFAPPMYIEWIGAQVGKLFAQVAG